MKGTPKVPSPKVHNIPGPAKNLGPHLKAPKAGEIVTTIKTWRRPA